MGCDILLTESEFIHEVEQSQLLIQRWIIGTNVSFDAQMLPKSWQPVIESLPPERRNLSLLALASQQQALFPVSQQNLADVIDIPMLPDILLNTLPDNLRPSFRQCLTLATKASMNSYLARLESFTFKTLGITELIDFNRADHSLLALLHERGYSCHPLDWMPELFATDVPEKYKPWSDWLFNVSIARKTDLQVLTLDNWDVWDLIDRVRKLSKMRESNPHEARQLIEARCHVEPVDSRIKLIETLAINLSDADAPFLESLLSNRSKKVISLAKELLLKLSNLTLENSDTAYEHLVKDLPQFYTLKNVGLIHKRLKLVPKKLNLLTDKEKRSDSLSRIPLLEIAKAFDLTPSQLCDVWDFKNNEPNDNLIFFRHAAQSITVTELDILVMNLFQSRHNQDECIYILINSIKGLNHDKSELLVTKALTLNTKHIELDWLLLFLNQPCLHLTWNDLANSYLWKSLISDITKDLQANDFIDDSIAIILTVLGLYLPQQLASRVLQFLIDTGISRTDPSLICLNFNAHLEPNG